MAKPRLVWFFWDEWEENMKYVIVLGDGMADRPIEELENKTPLEYAKTPMMDKLAQNGEIGLVHVLNDPLGDGGGSTVLGHHSRHTAVLVIGHTVQGRNVNAVDFGDFPQEGLLGPAFRLCPVVEGQHFHSHLFPFTQSKQINKVR